jgi:hypothetical protein
MRKAGACTPANPGTTPIREGSPRLRRRLAIARARRNVRARYWLATVTEGQLRRAYNRLVDIETRAR